MRANYRAKPRVCGVHCGLTGGCAVFLLLTCEQLGRGTPPLPPVPVSEMRQSLGTAVLFGMLELSDTDHTVPLMAPDEAQFASVMSAHGVADGSRVVLYSAQNVYWATRVWWLFRMFGFDGAAVLSGGLQKWRREGRPIETGPARLRPPAQFTVRRQRALMAGKDEVLAAMVQTTGGVFRVREDEPEPRVGAWLHRTR